MTKDPICGMTVDEATALHAEHAEHAGETFYFCSEHCRKKFLSTPANPKHEEKKEQKPLGKTIYTRPMHPEIEQDHPGDCPKCGMALEPMMATTGADDEESSELHDMTRRFWIGAALAVPGSSSRRADHDGGSPPEVRKRVFEPFYTTNIRASGTGLGLSISLGIVRQHGGELWCETETGQSTRFHVELPVLPRAPGGAAARAAG